MPSAPGPIVVAPAPATTPARLRSVPHPPTVASASPPAPSIPTANADPDTVAPEYSTGCTPALTGYTEWVDGAPHETGLTTAWAPNGRIVRVGGDAGQDLDLVGLRESRGGPTYAAVTARSDHPGGVNAVLADGSVRFIKDTVDGAAWRALGTIDGGEVVGADAS